jgi:bifunctional UDP-N-acetylglucosamine pyrophosphorylase/glucosamine-1-phosphate N-acetyltransferase
MKAVILAGGRGVRLEPLTHTLPKAMLPLAGRPLLEHLIEAVREVGIREVDLVVGPDGGEIREYFREGERHSVEIEYFVQEEPLGTAHALGMARQEEEFLALNGDTFLSPPALEALLEAGPSAAVLGLKKRENPVGYGVVEMEGDRVKGIREKPSGVASGWVNAGVYRFTPQIFEAIERTPPSPRGEYELTASIQALVEEGETVRGIEIPGPWLDLGTPWTYLDSNREVLKGMEGKIEGRIEDFVTIRGEVHLGKGAVIRSGSTIEGPCYIGEGTVVGPNAFLREFSSIGRDCRIGNGVEVKNSIVMDGTRVPHLSYIGDSILGRNCNLGAGTLVGNLRLDGEEVKMRTKGELQGTGRRKMGCVLGDGVKTGLNVMINAGRKIGECSLIGPGVIVYSDLPPRSRVRVRQELEKGRVKRG